VNVFVDAPADLRLIWRIRRDLADRGRSVEQVLHHDAGPVRAAYERYVRRRVPTPTTSSPTTARSRTRWAGPRPRTQAAGSRASPAPGSR